MVIGKSSRADDKLNCSWSLHCERQIGCVDQTGKRLVQFVMVMTLGSRSLILGLQSHVLQAVSTKNYGFF